MADTEKLKKKKKKMREKAQEIAAQVLEAADKGNPFAGAGIIYKELERIISEVIAPLEAELARLRRERREIGKLVGWKEISARSPLSLLTEELARVRQKLEKAKFTLSIALSMDVSQMAAKLAAHAEAERELRQEREQLIGDLRAAAQDYTEQSQAVRELLEVWDAYDAESATSPKVDLRWKVRASVERLRKLLEPKEEK